jgi:hypothetical protein
MKVGASYWRNPVRGSLNSLTYDTFLGFFFFGLRKATGLERSKRIGSRCVSGRTRAWLKTKNPDFERQ